MVRKLERREVIDLIARTVYEMNRMYCEGFGDESNPPWSYTPTVRRQSYHDRVQGVLDGNTPEQTHELWLSAIRAHGWTYGEVKNEALKQHPCIVAYEDLDPLQRVRYQLFVIATRGMLRHYGLIDAQGTITPE